VTFGRVALAAGAVATVFTFAVFPLGREASLPAFAASHQDVPWPIARGHEQQQQQRDDAFRHAKVWTPADPAAVDFKSNPADASGLLSNPPGGVVRCRYLSDAPHGTTPKFDCVLTNGEVVKVKYGWATAEVHAEVAATRLLEALGFGADQMFFLPHLRCFGCPRFPFEVARGLDLVGMRETVVRRLPDDRFVDFEWVAVERRFAGREIVFADKKGWAWWELDRVDSSSGASRAELDALRLMARFLAHWDNKAANQRLVCLSPVAPARAAETPCRQPFAFIQDLGATFGPKKIDLKGWEAARVWADARACRVSMKDFPYDGGTFPDAQISEAGRALAARQLGALSDQQIVDLFEAVRFSTFRGWKLHAWPVSEWARVFHQKVDDIRSAGPCPAPRQPSSRSSSN